MLKFLVILCKKTFCQKKLAKIKEEMPRKRLLRHFFYFNSSPHEQNGRHFADDILSWIFVNEKLCILKIKISMKFVPKGPIDNNPALV